MSRRNCHQASSPTPTRATVRAVWSGSLATIPPKMRRETPLPTPYSVMISPIQVSTIVPAVSVVTIRAKVSGRWSGSAPRFRMRKVWPIAWITARTTVRYRVYWASLRLPASPSSVAISLSWGKTTWRRLMMMEAVM
jgi:hypothetical protein